MVKLLKGLLVIPLDFIDLEAWLQGSPKREGGHWRNEWTDIEPMDLRYRTSSLEA